VVAVVSCNYLSFQIGVRAIVRHPREKLLGLRTMSVKRLFRAQPIHRSPRKDLPGRNQGIQSTITYRTIGKHQIVLRNVLGTCRIVIALVVECLGGILSHKTPWNTSSWSPVAAKTEDWEWLQP
jgi:hypothetical protein